jgi:ubiquitin-like protein Pup
MPRHVQQLSRPRRTRPPTTEDQPPKRMEVEDIDSILDGVDAILEENESAVLRSYRQRGGQ